MPITVEPDPLTSGEDATITYGSGADAAGDTITVEIDDGGQPTPQTDTVTIELDGSGAGTGTWEVPAGWGLANFNVSGCPEVTRLITASDTESHP